MILLSLHPRVGVGGMLSIGGMTTTTDNSRAGPTRDFLARRQLGEPAGNGGISGKASTAGRAGRVGLAGDKPQPYMFFLRMSAC